MSSETCLLIGIIYILIVLIIGITASLYNKIQGLIFNYKKRKFLNKIMQRAHLYSSFCLCEYCVHCTKVIEHGNGTYSVFTRCPSLEDKNKYHGTVRFCNEFELDPSKIYFD